MVSDGEATVQAKCLELLEETIFHHIVPYQSESSAAQLLVWSLLKIIAAPENMDFRFLHSPLHWRSFTDVLRMEGGGLEVGSRSLDLRGDPGGLVLEEIQVEWYYGESR